MCVTEVAVGGAGDREAAGDRLEVEWLASGEQRAWRAFIEGSQRLFEVLNRGLVDKHGLSMDDYRILVKLSESPNGSLRMSELADGVVASRSKLTHQIRRMEAENLVTRGGCDSDRRGVNAVITEVGRDRLAAAAPDHVADVRRYMVDALTPDQLRTVAEVFEQVNAATAANG